MPLGTEVGLVPSHIVLDGTHLAPPPKRAQQPLTFRCLTVVMKRLDGTEVELGSGHIVLDGDPAPHPRKEHNSPHFSAHVYCDQTVPHLSSC